MFKSRLNRKLFINTSFSKTETNDGKLFPVKGTPLDLILALKSGYFFGGR